MSNSQILTYHPETETSDPRQTGGPYSETEPSDASNYSVDARQLHNLAIVYTRNGTATEAGLSFARNTTLSDAIVHLGPLLLENLKRRRVYNWVAEQQCYGQPNWLDVSYCSVDSLSMKQIGLIVDQVSSALHERKFAMIDHGLSIAIPEKMSTDAIVTLARVTFPARRSLANWYGFLLRAKSSLNSRGAAADELVGLD